jgi:DNA replication protein DnaC
VIRGISLGKRFKKATFESFTVTRYNSDAYNACRDLATGKNGGVILIGPVGVGKTHLMVALTREYDRLNSYVPEPIESSMPQRQIPSASELIAQASEELEEDTPTILSLRMSEIERHAHIEYWPMLDLSSELRSASMTGDLSLSLRCRTCDLLILDDLGREKISEFILQEFQRIIDWRYREMLPIAVATNLERGDIAERYGEHTSSRWIGSCEVIAVHGPDYRVDS